MAAKWMQHEANREKKAGTKGTLRRAAARAGMSTKAFAEQHKHDSGKNGARSRLALTFMAHRP